MILAPLQKLPKNVGNLGKLIVAKGFKKLPKVQKNRHTGHTALHFHFVERGSKCFSDTPSTQVPLPMPDSS